jgi:3-polyprenyl-4-hydroxybenzoate decarboxylase
MQIADLREYIKIVEERGELKKISGVDCNLDIGAITELAASIPECPAVIFETSRDSLKSTRY